MKLLYFIGWFLMLKSLAIGYTLTYSTRDLEYKVALCFVMFLIGIFLLIKSKEINCLHVFKYNRYGFPQYRECSICKLHQKKEFYQENWVRCRKRHDLPLSKK